MSTHTSNTARAALVSVIVPVFRNEQSLPVLFDAIGEVEQSLGEKGLGLELIFVDDGSPDRSLSVLLEFKRLRPATRIIKLTRNFGAVHASKTGMRFVTGDCFLILAADLQDPPALIVEAAARWLDGAKYVICVRESRQDPLPSRVLASLYYLVLRLWVVHDYPRGGYDMALMGREFLPYMVESAKNVNTPLYAFWLGFTPEKILYTRQRRRHGKSAWTFRKRFTFFLDSVLGFSIVPIRVISLFGVLVAMASFGYGGVIAVNALRGIRGVPGFAALAVIISFLLGVVIVMLGVIGEYLWRIYDQVSGKPETVIEEVF